MKRIGRCEDCGRKVYIDMDSRCKRCRVDFSPAENEADEAK